MKITENSDSELEKLSKNYNVTKKEQLEEYLKEHAELLPYLEIITPIINKHFPNNEKYLTYYTNPEFEDLNTAQICVIGNDSLFEKERSQMQTLKNEILHISEFPVQVKSLISVRLWWL